MRFIVQELCVSIGPSLRSVVENFCVDFDRSVNEAVHAGSVGSQFHIDSAIEDITLRFSESTASDDGDALKALLIHC